MAKDHYVPVSYQRQWCTTEPGESEKLGKLWCYRRLRGGEVDEERMSPRATGYEHHLYTLKPGDPEIDSNNLEILEKSVLQKIDSEGAIILRKLCDGGPEALTPNERGLWSLYVSTLMERHPTSIVERTEATKQRIRALMDETRGRDLRPELRAVTEQMFQEINIDDKAHNGARVQAWDAARDPKMLEYIQQLHWTVLTSAIDLMTSDDPLEINLGVASAPIVLMSIAISPKKLLAMHHPKAGLDVETFNQIVAIHNPNLLLRRAKCLYSVSAIADGPLLNMKTAVFDQWGKLPLPDPDSWEDQ